MNTENAFPHSEKAFLYSKKTLLHFKKACDVVSPSLAVPEQDLCATLSIRTSRLYICTASYVGSKYTNSNVPKANKRVTNLDTALIGC